MRPKSDLALMREAFEAAWQLVDGEEEPPADTGPLMIEAVLHCYQHEIRALRLALQAVPMRFRPRTSKRRARQAVPSNSEDKS